MKDTYVFKGKTHRVQLVIFDFTTPDTPPSCKEERPKFCVRTLPNTANVYTSYSVAGDQPYYGDDPDVAWNTVQRYIPNLFHQCPAHLRRYLVRWAKTEVPRANN